MGQVGQENGWVVGQFSAKSCGSAWVVGQFSAQSCGSRWVVGHLAVGHCGSWVTQAKDVILLFLDSKKIDKDTSVFR